MPTHEELLTAAVLAGLAPKVAAAGLTAPLLGQDVRAYVIIPYTATEGGTPFALAAAVTDHALYHWWWGVTPRPEPTSEDRRRGEIALLESLMDPDATPAEPAEDAPVVGLSARTLPLSKVCEVRTDAQYSPTGDLQGLSVTITSAVPDSFSVAPAMCDDPNCADEHPYRGWLLNELVLLEMSREEHGPDAVQALAAFGSVTAALLARR